VHQQQGQQDVQEEAEEEQVDSSIINVSTNSDNMAPGDEEDNQNIIINSVSFNGTGQRHITVI
jgi:hypothetical protein